MKKVIMTVVVYLGVTFLNFLLHANLSTNYAMEGNYDGIKAPSILSYKTENIFADEIIYRDIKATVYHAEVSQCDDTPFITADNSFIDTARVNQLRWIAVSRDIVNLKTPRYNFKGKLKLGDTVWISYDKEAVYRHAKENKLDSGRTARLIKKYDKIVGWWVVKDTMGDYFWEPTNILPKNMTTAMIKNSDYKLENRVVFKKHYQRKWIDFLQHPKTGMLDYWTKSIIITKRRVIGHNTELIDG